MDLKLGGFQSILVRKSLQELYYVFGPIGPDANVEKVLAS